MLYDKNANTVNNHVYNIKESNKAKKTHSKENSSIQPEKYLVDDYTVFIGKNNKQNDIIPLE